MVETADVVIIGGGIAGVSAGWFLADRGLTVHLLEAEATLAHHTTGRSAAQYLETYGNDVVRRLTVASRSFFADPPAELVDGPLWSPRPMMRVGGTAHVARLRTEAEAARALAPSTSFVDTAGALELCSALRPDMVAGAVLEPEAMELDVAGINQAFVRGIRRRDGTISTRCPVIGLERADTGWKVAVNAAGAWCDRVASMAGLDGVGLRPLRRTVAIVAVHEDFDTSAWPLVAFEADDGSMEGYFKPEPGGLLVSPADETPSEPCDARPEELDVALGLDVVSRWTTLELRHVRSSWAGLRSFVADRTFVVGSAPDGDGFFWLAGQGGYGIQTAPGLGRAVAGLVVDGRLPADLATH
ncbi:MAG: NAD(P)/FAD-dependent oxidoreductase, partial [Acidimicrobiales bacterium]